LTAVPATLRTITFGDLEAGLWGVVFGGDAPRGLLDSSGSRFSLEPAAIDGDGDGDDWRLATPVGELTIAPLGPAVRGEPAEASAGFEQLCRVHGRLKPGGTELKLDCLGRRGTRSPVDGQSFESVRDVSAWFAADDGVAVLAMRPRKAAGHGGDLIRAAVFGAAGPLTVTEARLSTSYSAADELPARTGLELWIGTEEAEQYPLRIAGEATGAPASFTLADSELSATLLRCHSRGREGTGIYLLARLS
jgi:hypothetical protein